MAEKMENQQNKKLGKSMLDVTLEITDLHDVEHPKDAIPGSGRDVVIP
jgi:hypothetical protein